MKTKTKSNSKKYEYTAKETIDDIVKEIRANAEHNHALVEVSKYLVEIADRIDAALEHLV